MAKNKYFTHDLTPYLFFIVSLPDNKKICKPVTYFIIFMKKFVCMKKKRALQLFFIWLTD
ncbi:hypothetical protein CHCC20335_0601 [Bacillus paralicheniformis]|nr:hypothetical protein CHCC20335_0601 [Bacillus paralicheniformis]